MIIYGNFYNNFRPMKLPLPPFPNPIFNTDALRGIEKLAAALSGASLMPIAGLAAAELARELLPGTATSVLVVAGPGNNGGDALVAARHLKNWFYRVDLVFLGTVDTLSPDAQAAHGAWLAAGGTCLGTIPDSGTWDLVIDGLFGIGLERPLEGMFADTVAALNALNTPILSLDVPSGLNADSGQVMGCAVHASHTLTFIGLKPGLLTADGPDYCGDITLHTLELNTVAMAPPNGWLLERPLVAKLLPRRALNSHKAVFGSAAILGGANGMAGAALLAARAALKLGAGRVYAGLLDDTLSGLDLAQPELMLRAPDALLAQDNLTALVVGPGLGQSAQAARLLRQAIERPLPLVIDADGLNLLAADAELQDLCAQRGAPTVLTPHPAEAARLIGCATEDVNYQRPDVATILATRLNAFVVLKGVGSVVAQPNAAWYLNGSGNPGLASAGTGDVLAGMIGALLAQGMSMRDAVLLGVHLHGAAADELAGAGIGPVGMSASEVIDAARALLNNWVYG